MVKLFRYSMLVVLLLLSCVVKAVDYTVEQVPNVYAQDKRRFVTNPDNLLTFEMQTKIDSVLANVNRTTTVEVALVAINSVGTADCYDFALKLFEYWKLGKASNDNGLLILYVANERYVKIMTGYGLEGVLPDAICNRVLRDTMFPMMKKGDIGGGLYAGVLQIADILNNPENYSELYGEAKASETDWMMVLYIYLLINAIVSLLLVIYTFVIILSKNPRNIKHVRLISFNDVLVLFVLIFPLPIYFLFTYVKSKSNRLRYAPLKCERCSNTMRLLSEQEEDKYLDRSQQKEEEVNSVDYDVWFCDECHNLKIFAYDSANTSYKRCPSCKAKTYVLQSDRIITRATQISQGKGEKYSVCRNCGYDHKEFYAIPPLPIVIAPSSRSGRGGGFGGGFGGGSFGGGRTGGGGAGGRF